MTNPAANYYFDLLRTIVDDVTARGRTPFAAGLKPRLQSLSNGEFDETRLGFPTFKDFLHEAERAGVVDLRRTPSDLVVEPRQGPAAKPSDGIAERNLRGRKVRRDLWRAWIEWSPGLKRYYDKEADRVLFLLDSADGSEPKSLAATRSQIAADPARFVAIEPISSVATVEAMTDFAASWDNDIDKAAMLKALESASPEEAAMNFTRLLRAVSQPVGAAWHRRRLLQVSEAIEAWKREHNLEVEHLVQAQASVRKADVSPKKTEGIEEDEIRARVLAAVERMPLSDVLRLAIPVEYLLAR